MLKIILATLIFIISPAMLANQRAADGGGAMPLPRQDHITAEQRTAIEVEVAKYRSQPRQLFPKGSVETKFVWPVQPSLAADTLAIHGTSNFVDQDDAFPGLVSDYACGQRTYDVDNGYNHDGVDIFTWPFSWRLMEADLAKIVAAADGVIAGKVDRHDDRSCGSEFSAPANFIVIDHDDGTSSQYLHLKQASATSKNVGERVKVGEYLGIVGSSGFSTGPHLHFEVHAADNSLLEPFAGECNRLNAESFWVAQPPYYDSAINRIATHAAPPEFKTCPISSDPHLADRFEPGDSVFFAIYLRDELRGQTADLRVIDPHGELVDSWQHSMDQGDHFAASYWYWSRALPTDATGGTWTFEVDFQGSTIRHPFQVGAALPPPEPPPADLQIYSGLWYNADAEGDGFNIVNTSSGMIVFYFGSTAQDQRLWLISEQYRGEIMSNEPIEIDLFESTGGNFSKPISSTAGLSLWGRLTLDFDDCTMGNASLVGLDGSKSATITKLAGISGAGCGSDKPSNEAGYAGIAYDPALEGEGYNIIVAPHGTVIFYYGFDQRGQRQWLVTDLSTATIEPNTDIEITTHRANGGSFDTPLPSSESLEIWGKMTLHFESCTSGTITMEGIDGRKTSRIVQLAGIDAASCDS